MRYEAPSSFEEASGLLAGETGVTRILAGGTDVLVQLRSGLVEPDLIVDIKRIPGAKDITRTDDGGWRIGAAVSGAEMGEHAELKAAWPGIVEAVELIGSTQVQGRCTMAGNLCNGSPAADSVPAMIAADAIAEVVGPSGTRDVYVEEIPLGPGRTRLEKGDVIAAIRLPARPERAGDAYLRFIPRTEMDIAVVSAGVSLCLDASGKVLDARIGLGAVGPTVVNAAAAADAIIGTTLDDAAIAAMIEAVATACSPIDDKRGTVKFRTKVAGVLAKRAALKAAERAKA